MIMILRCYSICRLAIALTLGGISAGVLGADLLQTSGFTTCLTNSDVKVQKANVQYDRMSGVVTFDMAGTSAKQQNVTASLTISAYGKEVYQKNFDPCAAETRVQQLCPIPSGSFAAQGLQNVPSEYASQIPSIAFTVPDLEGQAKLVLKATDGGAELGCVESSVSNGKTLQVPAVSYMAMGIAGATIMLSGISALGNAGSAGSHTPSPSFGDVIGWFQSMAMNGMLSVSYPPVYRRFTQNFAFSGGLIPWNSMQTSIDGFRNATGGNLTEDSVQYLRNASLLFSGGSRNSSSKAKRAMMSHVEWPFLSSRSVSVDVNGTQTKNSSSTAGGDETSHIVHGIQAYVEQLTIPQANTFMTVLLIFAIVIAAITVGILLFKVILEVWALFGSFPKNLTSFRKRYWGLLARTITNLVLILYGVWTLYCVYQFTHGDSWAAKVLAGMTFAMFTAILGFFTFRIWQIARRLKKADGDTAALFEDKETWLKYSLFYDAYKQGCWWIFVPAIVYMFAKGCVLAAGDGHGLAQTAGQLVIESLMMTLLLWRRPYVTKAGNWINVVIQVVRVLSVICILVFVEELGIAQSTKTITGVVLIVVQSVLTATLAILIAVNSIVFCCKVNPHRKRRKEAEKINRDIDNLIPLDARNSLLMDPADYPDHRPRGQDKNGYPLSTYNSNASYDHVAPYRDQTPRRQWERQESSEHLISSAASMGHEKIRTSSPDSEDARPARLTRQPTVPNMGDYWGRGS